MIPNGKIDPDQHNGPTNPSKEKKMFNAFSQRMETTESHQNDHRHDMDVSTHYENGHTSDCKQVEKNEDYIWNRNLPVEDNNTMSFDQMWELNRILDKRVKHKLSEGLSPEGKKAMELARAEVELSKRRGKIVSASNEDSDYSRRSDEKKKVKVKKRISFVDAYESSSASRLSGDIMDENSSEGNPKRWALGGGNINVAMETVEIVSYGDTLSDSEADDMAIEETAKLNSVEKCLVWMGVHQDDDYDEER